MSARQFWAMTMREVRWRIEAEMERENRAMDRQAQLACWLLNEHRKKKDHLIVTNLVRRKPRMPAAD